MEYKFSNLFEWTSGKPITPTYGNVPVYGSNGIIGYTEKSKYSNKIILGRVGAYCGSVAYCDGEFNATDNTLITTCKEDKIGYKFAYYLLSQYKLNDFAGGSAQPLITQGLLKHLKCNIPSLEEQDKIASILSAYDSLIEANNKRIKILEQMAENLYKEWFVRFRFPGHEAAEFENGIPKGWEYTEFSKVFSVARGVSYSSEEIDCEDGENLINLKNIQGYGGFRRDGTKKYNGKYKAEQKVGYKDLVMGVTDMTQDRRTVGSVALIPSIDGVISADLVKLNSSISNIFSYCLFRFGTYSTYISQFGNGANVIHLKPDAIKNVKLLIPSIEVINQFVQKGETIIDQIDLLNQKNDNLTHQRDLLLPRLMSGKLEV